MSVWCGTAAGRVLTRSGDAPPPPLPQQDGFATLQLGEPPQAWRGVCALSETRDRKVMVMVSLRERDDLANDIADQSRAARAVAAAGDRAGAGLAIRRGLRPLYELSREVGALDIHKERPLSTADRQEELKAMAEAINTLVARYHAALTRERALADEFAHELRTPLAALRCRRALLGEQRMARRGPKRWPGWNATRCVPGRC
jgi:two-component system sensor histidine kinase QseC